MLLITFVLGDTMASFYGELGPPRNKTTAGLRRWGKFTTEQDAYLRNALGLPRQFINDFQREFQRVQRQNEQPEQCTCCRKSNDCKQESERFKVCKQCNAIGRIVRYCSRYGACL